MVSFGISSSEAPTKNYLKTNAYLHFSAMTRNIQLSVEMLNFLIKYMRDKQKVYCALEEHLFTCTNVVDKEKFMDAKIEYVLDPASKSKLDIKLEHIMSHCEDDVEKIGRSLAEEKPQKKKAEEEPKKEKAEEKPKKKKSKKEKRKEEDAEEEL